MNHGDAEPSAHAHVKPPALRAQLLSAFERVRATTERLAAPLSDEDQALQSMPSTSPTKWHRAHTTWFFETFVLGPAGIAPHDERWAQLFNSYYVALGPRHDRLKRGIISRPSTAEIAVYRERVDARVVTLLERIDDRALAMLRPTFELGLAHEQQHQELLLTDILHALHENPLKPAYRASGASPRTAPTRAPTHAGAEQKPPPLLTHPRGAGTPAERQNLRELDLGASADGSRRPFLPSPAGPLRFIAFDGGLVHVGAHPASAFHFDNEAPRHRAFLEPFSLADRLVTVGEWKAFSDARGYETPALWLSDGFDWVQQHDVRAPLYAERDGTALVVYGVDGLREALDDEPVAHVSYYEADALARFLGARLPTEAEWELAAAPLASNDGNFLDDDLLRPRAAPHAPGLRQLYGDAWAWTQSAYGPYPGFRPASGAIGEYNGKFMANQVVLRGGSCFTPRGHVRSTYRNFWHPETRFQVSGVRLARTLDG